MESYPCVYARLAQVPAGRVRITSDGGAHAGTKPAWPTGVTMAASHQRLRRQRFVVADEMDVGHDGGDSYILRTGVLEILSF
jgi:hypothetical protein